MAYYMRIRDWSSDVCSSDLMRTDGVQMDPGAIHALRDAIAERYDPTFLPEKPRFYATKAKNAQEAHEAIRPTNFSRDHAGSGDEGKLYTLIFRRAMASQMASAQLERTPAHGRASCRERGCQDV